MVGQAHRHAVPRARVLAPRLAQRMAGRIGVPMCTQHATRHKLAGGGATNFRSVQARRPRMKTCRRGSIAPCPASALRRAQTGTDAWLRAGARGRKIAIELGCIWVLLSSQAPASADRSYARPCRRVPSLRLRGGRDAPWDHEAGPGGAVCNGELPCTSSSARVSVAAVPHAGVFTPAQARAGADAGSRVAQTG